MKFGCDQGMERSQCPTRHESKVFMDSEKFYIPPLHVCQNWGIQDFSVMPMTFPHNRDSSLMSLGVSALGQWVDAATLKQGSGRNFFPGSSSGGGQVGVGRGRLAGQGRSGGGRLRSPKS